VPKPSGDLRPISILPFLSKAIEKIMQIQITNYLDRKKILNDCQSGFRKNHSCTTALLNVVEDIRSNIDSNLFCILILLDHSKAFDSVDPQISCSKLFNLHMFSATATKLIQSYLSKRKQCVCVNDLISSPLEIKKGVPQGSILGPLLFNLYINDLPSVLKLTKIHIYADDIQIYLYCNKHYISKSLNDINLDLDRIYNWAKSNHLCINPSKSKCLIIGKKQIDTSEFIPPHIGNEPINFCNHAKNLGITFNQTLNWDNHISIVVGKVYGMLRILWKSQHFTPIHIRLLLSKTYLIPTLLYGCEIFANCDQLSQHKMNVLYNNIARYIFNRRRFDHISDCSKQIFSISFDNLLKLRTLSTLHKIINSKTPEYLYNKITFTRSSRSNNILIPRHKILTSERQFFIHSARLWNLLPNSIKTLTNTYTFKKSATSSLNDNY